MAKSVNLVGMQFGEWSVIEFKGTNKWNSKQYLCRCSCGHEQVIDGNTLRRGQTKQCKDCKNRKQVVDRIGQKFGELEVVEYLGIKDGHANWKCRCSCGSYVNVRSSDLLEIRSCKSCACVKIREDKRINLIGTKIGRLTVVDYGYSDKESYYWKCQCECGNVVYIRATSLTQEQTKSCGCLNKDTIAEIGRQQKRELNPRWNSELTEEERIKGRNIEGYTEWTIAVKRKCGFVCDCCGVKGNGKNLISHHLDGYNWCKEKRTDVENGVCLCVDCHNEFHSKYGKGNNTKEQYIEFKEIKS